MSRAVLPGRTSPTGTTTSTTTSHAGSTGTSTNSGGAPASGAPASSHDNRVDLAKQSAVGADDSLLLAVLVLAFAIAVSGVVVVAGRRGGRRVR